MPLEYLRFVRGDGGWEPAAGRFAGWPDRASEIRILDPCCGSGHFLAAALDAIVPMRMAEEGLTAREAVDAALRDNLHGLELDGRCVEIAAFALALEAWTYPEAGGYRALPEMNLACSGLAVGPDVDGWLALAGEDQRLRSALLSLRRLSGDAPLLGSLIEPEESLGKGALFVTKRESVRPLLDRVPGGGSRGEIAEPAVTALGIARAAELLARNTR